MSGFFQKDFSDNEQKINRIIDSLEEGAVYIRQMNDKLNKLSEEWKAIKEKLPDNDMAKNIKIRDIDNDLNIQAGSAEREMEELILCIIKEVNNHHIEFVCLN